MNREEIAALEALLDEPLGRITEGIVSPPSGRKYFLKRGNTSDAFRCEANGLRELAGSKTVRVAEPVLAGDDFILTGYIEGCSPRNGFFEEFGRCLARMHRCTSDSFGFYEDNFIGATSQPNRPSDEEMSDWCAFYWNKRLLFQYRLAERNGRVSNALKNAFLRMESGIALWLTGSEEPPALLHGDLWAGNFLCDKENRPVLIDPAVYYGHREAELAMTKLFGGFSPAFYEAYQREYPLPEGWEYRENLYLLYHVMNHLNLFGRSYLRQAEYLAESCCREARRTIPKLSGRT